MKHNLDHVFNFIVGYKMGHDGNSPSIREIGQGCGISSTSVVKHVLGRLVKDGRLQLNGNLGSRQIEVVGGEWHGP